MYIQDCNSWGVKSKITTYNINKYQQKSTNPKGQKGTKRNKKELHKKSQKFTLHRSVKGQVNF